MHLVTRGTTTGTVKAAGDLVTMQGVGDKRQVVIEEDQDGNPWSEYYSLYTVTRWL